MDLQILWFIIIGVLFAGYFLLEGFDFGVGMLLPFLGGKDAKERAERRTAAVKSIGPVWDGNEVWLITAGAAMFAAFPEWYATLFSGFYLPLLLILLSLIMRGVGLEWRTKVETQRWRNLCDVGTAIGSWVPALLWGVAFANILRGVPIDADRQIDSGVEGLLGLLNPYGLLGGLAFVLLFMLHGAMFLGFKTTDPVRARVHQIGLKWLTLRPSSSSSRSPCGRRTCTAAPRPGGPSPCWARPCSSASPRWPRAGTAGPSPRRRSRCSP